MSEAQAQSTGRFQSLWRGFGHPFRAGIWLLRTSGVKRFAVLPFIANLFLYVGVVIFAIYLVANWNPQVDAWEFWGPVGGWLSSAINAVSGWAKWLLSIPLLFFTCYFTFTAVGMVIASPLNDLLSDRVERKLCEPPEDQSLSYRLTAKILVRSVFDSLIIVMKQGAAIVLVLPFLLLPFVGFIPLLLVTAYFSGLGFFDIPLVRHNLTGRHKQAVLTGRRWEALGMGLAMEFLFYVPFVGLLMLPIGVTAGTLLYCRMDWSTLFEGDELAAPDGFAPPIPKSVDSK